MANQKNSLKMVQGESKFSRDYSVCLEHTKVDDVPDMFKLLN
jgi:hypothetical protein